MLSTPNSLLAFIDAWLVDEDERVVDPTWDDCNAAYLGIPFNTKWFVELVRSRNRGDCLTVFVCGFGIADEKFWSLRDFLTLTV